MLRVGLTGPAGAGKSLVAGVFAERGIPVIDADRAAHELYVPGSEVVLRIAAEFGDGVLDPAGAVDRGRLGAIVFSDPAALARLGEIVHPLLLRELTDRLNRLERSGATLAVLEAALLLGWGRDRLVDVVVGVTAPRAVRRARLVALGRDPADAERRLDGQVPEEALRAGSDHLLMNDGSPGDLVRCARDLAIRLERMAAERGPRTRPDIPGRKE